MPSFHDRATSVAAPEEVWKLLYDPARFPEWWAGLESVDLEAKGNGEGDYTVYPDGYPDFPMPQLLDTRRDEHRVTVSCLVSYLRFEWRLEPWEEGTLISVEVDIPEAEGHRLETQRESISASLAQLADLAATRAS